MTNSKSQIANSKSPVSNLQFSISALKRTLMVTALALLVTLTACGPAAEPSTGRDVGQTPPELTAVPLGDGEKLKVVATTTLVGDVVRTVGGDAIELTVLLPVGADPHAFEPTPRDVAAAADAHVIFVNGAGLEIFLRRLLENAGGDAAVVSVSDGIEFRRLAGEHGDEHESGTEMATDGRTDPHVWFNPLNVVVWTRNVERTLSALDPTHAETYAGNARQYRAKLQALDAWITDQVAQVPQARRKLVTDHTSFGYFADRYGFEQVGAIFPGFSSAAAPSAQDLVRLEDAIREFDVPAIFVGTTVNPNLAQRIADDTGIRVVSLYTGSLSEPGGPADSYLAFMRYNVTAIVNALK